MTEVKEKTTTRAKKTTKKEVVEKAPNPMEEVLKSMTPEMMQQFMMFMQQQTQNTEHNVKKEKKEKINKSYLSRIRDREVVVRSVSHAVIGFDSRKTNVVYKWMNYGDTEILTVGDILEMDGRSKLFLHTPWLVVEDDEVNEALGLIEQKEITDVFEDFENFLELPVSEMKIHLSKLDKQYLSTICVKVQQAINDGILTDFRKIREIEKITKAEFRY